MAIHLIGTGTRASVGETYQKMYEDIDRNWGSQFLTRNDNGRRRKLTAKARAKQHQSLSPNESESEPLVVITHYSTADGRKVPPYFSLLSAEDEFLLELFLPLEADTRHQADDLLKLVAGWLPGPSFVGGTISPAIVHSANAKWTVEDPEFVRARSELPGFQFVPFPPVLGHLNGLGNWGEITLLGPDTLNKASVRKSGNLPSWLSVQLLEAGAAVQAADRDVSLAAISFNDAHSLFYREMAELLKPARSSAYDKYLPDEEWFRVNVDWVNRAGEHEA